MWRHGVPNYLHYLQYLRAALRTCPSTSDPRGSRFPWFVTSSVTTRGHNWTFENYVCKMKFISLYSYRPPNKNGKTQCTKERSGLHERGVLSLHPEGKRVRKDRITPESFGGPIAARSPVCGGEREQPGAPARPFRGLTSGCCLGPCPLPSVMIVPGASKRPSLERTHELPGSKG